MCEEEKVVVKATKSGRLKRGLERRYESGPLTRDEADKEKAMLSREGYDVKIIPSEGPDEIEK